jgi:hypothetical protein
MDKTTATDEIRTKIWKRRTQCLIHRYLYYVLNQTLVPDQEYDRFERELRSLVANHPEIAAQVENHIFCPSRTVGSSLEENYPRNIGDRAISLLTYAPRFYSNSSQGLVSPELSEDSPNVAVEADSIEDETRETQGSLFG